MYTFVVDDKVGGVLLSLSALIERMQLQGIGSWRFKDITLMGYGYPFGMTFDEFEAASRAKPDGYEVSDSEYRKFLRSDFQIVDGEVEAWSAEMPRTCIVRLDCEDASQWEIATDSAEVAENLEQIGFARMS